LIETIRRLRSGRDFELCLEERSIFDALGLSARQRPICDVQLLGRGRYCPECGGRVWRGQGERYAWGMDLSLHPTLIPVPKSLMLNTRPSFTSGSRKAKPSHGTPQQPLARVCPSA